MKLYVLQLAINPTTGAPAPGYLIRTDDGTNVLVGHRIRRQDGGDQP